MRNVVFLLSILLVSAVACERDPREEMAGWAVGVPADVDAGQLTCDLSPMARSGAGRYPSYLLRDPEGLVRYRLDVFPAQEQRAGQVVVHRTGEKPLMISLMLAGPSLVVDDWSGPRTVAAQQVKGSREYGLAVRLYARCTGRSLEEGG